MPGEFVCLVGPSGCGKSTLLRVLAGLLPPNYGRVWLDGRPVTAPRRQVGIVFQQANLMPWRTVLGNVLLPLEVSGLPSAEARKRATALLQLVGLCDFGNAYPADLSGGMAQRVAIARALVNSPDIILADEPTGNLDSGATEEIVSIFRQLNQDGITVILVTHEMDIASQTKRVIRLLDGKVTSDEKITLKV